MEFFDSTGHLFGSSLEHADGSTSCFDHSGALIGGFHPTSDGGGVFTNAFGVTLDVIHPVVGGFHHTSAMGVPQMIERHLGETTYFQSPLGETFARLDPLTGNVTTALGGLAFRLR